MAHPQPARTNAEPFATLLDAARRRPPRLAVVLGSGLGDVPVRLRPVVSLRFEDVPDMASATVAGHRGELVLGDWCGVDVLAFVGRLHRYEGHSWDQVLAPVRLAHRLGAAELLLTNAVGGIREGFEPGTLVAVRDHLEWTRPCWWREAGPGGPGGIRRSPYDVEALGRMQVVARTLGFGLPSGLYAQVTGPCYETPAEIRALRACGADMVGMSTACEAACAAGLGMRVTAISCVTNRAAGLAAGPIRHDDVLAIGRRLQSSLAALIEAYLRGAEG